MSKIEKANSRTLSSAGLVVCCSYGQGLPSVALLVSLLKVPYSVRGEGRCDPSAVYFNAVTCTYMLHVLSFQ